MAYRVPSPSHIPGKQIVETLAAFALTRLMSGFVTESTWPIPCFTYGATALLLFVVALVGRAWCRRNVQRG